MKKLPYMRKQEILEMLKDNDYMNIDELSKKFNVSYMTIHRDLRELEESGELHRVYGGAKAVNNAAQTVISLTPQESSRSNKSGESWLYNDLTIEERFKREQHSKEAIAKEASKLIADGDVIAMDPSTTVLHMCSFLQNRNILVVTTSINVALQFSNSKTVQVMLVGGQLRKSSLAIVGAGFADFLDRMVINKCFLSSHCISFKHGLTDLTYEEAEAKRRLMKQSKETYILVDNTKICRDASFVVCDYREMSAIYTDSKEFMSEEKLECIKNYEDNDVKVIYSL